MDFPFSDDDGYTDRAYIYAKAEDIRLRVYFRPTNASDRADMRDRVNGADERRRFDLLTADMAERIKKWEFLDDKGNVLTHLRKGNKSVPVPEPTQEWIGKLRFCWGDLVGIVHYGTKSDHEDPFFGSQDKSPEETVRDNQKN